MFFAELGAQVVKIENKTTKGDVTRGWKHPVEDPSSPVSAYWSSVNWGKKHLMLDLENETDRTQALELALEADVVLSNFKPSSARRWALDGESLRSKQPSLIYAQLNAFSDPEDESPAFDAVLQAEAGFMYMNGEPDRAPVKMPVALIDVLAAHQLKEGILLALIHRERSGEGALVSASLIESALASLVNQATNFLMLGQIPQRMGARHPNIAPYGDIFNTLDGAPVLLAAGTERQFVQLCNCLGLEQLTGMEAFKNNASRVKNRSELNNLLSAAISLRKQEELMADLKKHGVPAAGIRDMKQVFDLPVAQEMILEERAEDGTRTRRLKTAAFHLQ